MNWHMHDWGRWEDVKLGDKPKVTSPAVSGFIVLRQIITQQRRCAVCNIVQTRHSA